MNNEQLELLKLAIKKTFGLSQGMAEKVVFKILKASSKEIDSLLEVIKNTKSTIIECKLCHNFGKNEICEICEERKNSKKVVFVEKAQDIKSFEQLGTYKGKYFVLSDLLSTKKQNFDQKLIEEILQYCTGIQEVILALPTNLNGQITMQRLKTILGANNIEVFQLSTGIPFGATIDIVDPITLKQSLEYKVKM
ncbi:toprim domain-containing protein [Mycoplasma sp. 128]